MSFYFLDYMFASCYRRWILTVRPVWDIIFVIPFSDLDNDCCCFCFGRCGFGLPFGRGFGFGRSSLGGSRVAIMLVWAISAVAPAFCEKETWLLTFWFGGALPFLNPSPPFSIPGTLAISSGTMFLCMTV